MTVAALRRWTIVRRATPAKRRSGDSSPRRRVWARCVCGHEQYVWGEDIDSGRSTGCKSPRCRAKWAAAVEFERRFGEMLQGFLRADPGGGMEEEEVEG